MAKDDDRERIELTSVKALRKLSRLYGAADVLEALKEKNGTLPGFQWAVAIAETEVNKARADWHQAVLKFASECGVAVHKVARVSSDFEGDKVFVVIEFEDLVDQAEQGG